MKTSVKRSMKGHAKHMLACLLSLVLILMAFAGCSSSSNNGETTGQAADTAGSTAAASGDSGKDQTINYLTLTEFADPLNEKGGILEKYNQETGVKVNCEGLAFNDLFDVIEIKINSGDTYYDVLQIDSPNVTSDASRGLLVDLNQYWTDEEKKQLTGVSVQAGTYQGHFYSPPMNTSSMTIFYNTKLLQDAGIKLPDNITVENRITWEDLRDLAKKGLEVLDPDKTKGIYGIEFRQVSRVYNMNPLPNSLGGLNIGEDGFTVDGVINSKPWIDGVTFYQKLVNDGISSRGVVADEERNLFVSDKVMFMLDNTTMLSFCKGKNMDHYGYFPQPAFKGHEDQVATATGSWHFGVNPHSTKPVELSNNFIKYMSIGEGADLWYQRYQQLPTKVALLNELVNDPNCSDFLKIVLYESSHTAVLRAMTPGFSEYSDILNNAWEDVRNGEDVTATLNDAVAKINSTMVKYKK